MKYVAGIDGGQTATHAVVAGERGPILGRGSAGPADELGVASNSTRLRDALRGSLDAARSDARLPPNALFDVVVAGLSGYGGRSRGVEPSLPAKRTILVHDSVTAHAAAFDREPGVVVIAGTGSFAFGRAADGTEKKAGGWGYLFGDEGGAFWIARTALSRAMRGEDSAVERKALEFFGAADLRALAKSVYAGTISRDRLASFAPVVLEIEPKRAREAGEALAALATAAFPDSGERPRVAFVGGVVRHPGVCRAIAAALRGRCLLLEAQRSPAEGALLLARRYLKEKET